MGFLVNSYRFISSTPFSDDTGLKAYWKFNETSGDIINVSESGVDLGSAADLQVTGATYNQGGITDLNYSMLYDGTNDFSVAGSSVSQFNFLHNDSYEFTMAFWGKILSWDGLDMIWSTANELASAYIGFGLRAQSSGSLYYHFANGTNQNRFKGSISGFNTDGAFHFYVITGDKSDSTDSLEMWEDGSSMGTASNSGMDFVDTNASQAAYQAQAGNSEQFGNFNIEEFSVWSRRLSDSEIAELYNSGDGLAIY